MLDDIDSFIQEHPDSALRELRSMSIEDFSRERDRADYALLLSMALDKNYIDVASDSLIRVACNYYLPRKEKSRAMLCLYYRGTTQFYAHDYPAAIVSFTRALDLAKETGSLRYQGLASMAMSHLYSETYNNTEALSYALAGVNCFAAIPDRKQLNNAKVHLANTYHNLHQLSEAEQIFKELVLTNANDSSLMRRVLPYYAACVLHSGDDRASEAVTLFEIANSEYHVPFSSKSLGDYSLALFLSGDLENANLLQKMLESSGKAKERVSYLKYRRAVSDQNYKEALAYQKESIDQMDSVFVKTLEQSVVKSQRDYFEQEWEVMRIREANRRLQVTLWVTCFFVLLLFAGGGVWLWARRKEQQTQQLNTSLQETRKLMQETDDMLQKARNEYVSAFKQQIAPIAQLSETYYRTSGKGEGRDLVYREVMELSRLIGTDRLNYQSLERKVNRKLENAMALYREEYPGGEEQEYRLVCYLMAGFPASTINLLTGLSPSAVYTRKSRLLETIRASGAPHASLFEWALQ